MAAADFSGLPFFWQLFGFWRLVFEICLELGFCLLEFGWSNVEQGLDGGRYYTIARTRTLELAFSNRKYKTGTLIILFDK
jgi:hypothetical protein